MNTRKGSVPSVSFSSEIVEIPSVMTESKNDVDGISEIDSVGLVPGDYSIRLVLHVPGDDNFDDWNQVVNFNILSHDINKTGFEYTSIWSPKTFLKSTWY